MYLFYDSFFLNMGYLFLHDLCILIPHFFFQMSDLFWLFFLHDSFVSIKFNHLYMIHLCFYMIQLISHV